MVRPALLAGWLWFSCSCLGYSQTAGTQPATEVPDNGDLTNNEVDSDGDGERFPERPLLPLKRVVLYSSGVGHMEHLGTIDGNAKQRIRFSGHDVDDVLKSLVFTDTSGGRIRAVEYQPAPDAESLAAQGTMGQPLTLAQTLQSLRGEALTLKYRNDAREGTIFGVENRAKGDSTVETLNLITERGLESLALEEVSEVQFVNEELRDELRRAMAGVAKSRQANQKQLDLLFEGQGQRQVAFAYVVDAPVWRISYRLEVQPDTIELQGWAHVNNVSGNDWEAVELELRSGQPTTFHAELFAPLLAERPSVGPNVYGFPTNLRLISQWFGMDPPSRFADFDSDLSLIAPSGGHFGGKAGGGMGGMGGMGFAPSNSDSEDDEDEDSGDQTVRSRIEITRGVEPMADSGRALQQVRFRLAQPVDLVSGKSASIPIIEQQLPADAFSLIVDDGDRKPLVPRKAVELTNTTTSALVPGPISVLESGVFAGDSTLDRVAMNGLARVIYGLDRGLVASKSEAAPVAQLQQIALAKGVVQLTNRESFTIQLTLRNEDSEPRVVMYDHAVVRDDAHYRVTSPAPEKLADGRAMFRIPVAPMSEQSFKILLEREYETTVPLSEVTLKQLDEWLTSTATLSPADRERLTQNANLMISIADAEQALQQLHDELRLLTADQERTRENLKSVGNDKQAAGSFTATLKELETSIRAANKQISESRKSLKELERNRERLIER